MKDREKLSREGNYLNPAFYLSFLSFTLVVKSNQLANASIADVAKSIFQSAGTTGKSLFTSYQRVGAIKKDCHTTYHVMAMAVQKLFPKAQVTIGPWIEKAFYYDFDNPEPFTEKDLKAI